MKFARRSVFFTTVLALGATCVTGAPHGGRPAALARRNILGAVSNLSDEAAQIVGNAGSVVDEAATAAAATTVASAESKAAIAAVGEGLKEVKPLVPLTGEAGSAADDAATAAAAAAVANAEPEAASAAVGEGVKEAKTLNLQPHAVRTFKVATNTTLGSINRAAANKAKLTKLTALESMPGDAAVDAAKATDSAAGAAHP